MTLIVLLTPHFEVYLCCMCLSANLFALSRELFVSDFIGVGGFNLWRNSIPFTHMTSVWPAVNCLTSGSSFSCTVVWCFLCLTR